ncbi:transposase family protein [Streptomyces sp. NPDC054945]
MTAAFGTVEVVARGRAAGAACPDCGRFSQRVHDRCRHRLNDLPLAEQGFVSRLTVRRFVCGSADCPRRWTPTSLTWSSDSPRDAPASPDYTVNWLPSKLLSPTAWSARTSLPCAQIRPGPRPGRRRCGR